MVVVSQSKFCRTLYTNLSFGLQFSEKNSFLGNIKYTHYTNLSFGLQFSEKNSFWTKIIKTHFLGNMRVVFKFSETIFG